MMLQDPFERLEPPPGGLDGLRRKLSPRRVARTWLALELAGVAAVLTLTLLATLRPGTSERTDYGIFQAWMEAPEQRDAITLLPGSDPGIALVPLASSNTGVSLYWMAESGSRGDPD